MKTNSSLSSAPEICLGIAHTTNLAFTVSDTSLTNGKKKLFIP